MWHIREHYGGCEQHPLLLEFWARVRLFGHFIFVVGSVWNAIIDMCFERVFIGSLCLLRNTRELNSMDLGFAFD